ncbi:phage holin family protein [Sanguibacter suaedae]|uniref:Phage holin family protein n=1 Tax=Sanguibacter suaedae TaxID=2795737 RepID=A0A934I9X6_9MICO|nr:phage holin family protein [Sanguibacter suaedae]MBI9115772.1 phage holin family protein [Sanguibacter suaedae]
MSQEDHGRVPLGTQKPSIGQLLEQMTEQVKTLVRAEIASAKAEMAAKAKNAGIGIGLFVGAAVLGLYAFGFLLHSGMVGLAHVVPLWLAALIVGIVLLAGAGALALVGKKMLSRGMPPAPTDAVQSVKADVDAVKNGATS